MVFLAESRKTAPAEEREHWHAARRMYQQSLDIWEDLRNRGTLAGDAAARPEQVTREIVKCDAFLGK